MNGNLKRNVILFFAWIFSLAVPSYASHLLDTIRNPTLERVYAYYASLTPLECDIGEHMHVLKRLAMECPIVTEIGLGNVVSTWALLQGLVKNPAEKRSYTGIDIRFPPIDNMLLAQKLAEDKGIIFSFRLGNDLRIEMLPTDLLFIDSMHTYCHLTYELETFSPYVRKYIAMHDTSEPWGDRDDHEYVGDYSEYPPHYNRFKRGLWAAVEDFLKTHPEWTLHERRLNCHGFTILKRVETLADAR